MPNRILHERICVSDTLAQLSGDEERLFYRLIVQCDDYGRFDGRVSVIRARCFPLQLDLVTDAWITAWLGRLVEVGLIATYAHEGQPFLRVVSWGRYQYPRAKHSKFPEPGNGVHASAGTCLQTPADSLVNDTGNVNEERRTKNEERKRSTSPLPPPPQAEEGERKSRRGRSARGMVEDEPAGPPSPEVPELAPLSSDDAALWERCRERLRADMSPTNHRRLVVALEPLGRAADGALYLRAPPGRGVAWRVESLLKRALLDEGEQHAAMARIVE